MKSFKYFAPQDVGLALSILRDYQGRASLLAGGTDLIPQMKKELISPEAVINLSSIAKLSNVGKTQRGLEIGAMVRLGDLERNSLLAGELGALREAISHLAARPLRNAATLGGNLCLDTKCIYRDQVQIWERSLNPCFKRGGDRCYVVRGGQTCHASLAGDTVPILMALQAKATVATSGGEKNIPLEELYTGNGIKPLALAADELLCGVVIPSQGRRRAAYLRYSLRRALDFPVVSAAVSLGRENGLAADARIVLGAVAPGTVRLPGVEKMLQGQKITEEILRQGSRQAPEEALKISRSGRIDSFARTLIANLVYRAIKQAWEAGGSGKEGLG